DHFTLKSEYDLFIGGSGRHPRAATTDTINPANEQKIALIAEANAADVDAAAESRARLRQRVEQGMPAAERASNIVASRACCRRKPASSPSRSSVGRRQGDIRRKSRRTRARRRALLHYAGWADKLGYVFPENGHVLHGVAVRIILELPRCSWSRG
ncbi:MAG: hypothetical protein IPG92_15990, partial [Flavobacteriales bacterium]|nr:hypothetical protein [Flavobacteriales bacterium]